MSKNPKCSAVNCENRAWARSMCRKHYMRWWVHGGAEKVLLQQSKAGDPQSFIDGLPTTGEGCVIWPFSTNNVGYAQIAIPRGKGKKLLVSRLVCERANGAAPSPDHVAAHECGNGHGACVAPWHLTWKTRVENSADMLKHGTLLHGESAPWAKLTLDDVHAIKRLADSMPQSQIATIYGISQASVSLIIRGKTWTTQQPRGLTWSKGHQSSSA